MKDEKKSINSHQDKSDLFRTEIESKIINHFTVVCSVTWPLNGSEAGGDLA